MAESLEKVLKERDGLTDEQVEKTIDELRATMYERLGNGEMPYDLLDDVGLEPDYLEYLLY